MLEQFKELFKLIEVRGGVDGVFLLGDIAEGEYSKIVLEELQKSISLPIMYVLGNHDFYGQWIDRARDCMQSDNYLSSRQDPLCLSATSCVIGHDGWADGRAGDYFSSKIILRDFREILDFKARTREELFEQMNERAEEAVDHIRQQLFEAVATGYRSCLILTHVPPFLEACLWDGAVAEGGWAPFFVSKAMGDMLSDFFRSHDRMHGVVLAGHSHHRAFAKILPNLEVHVLPAACELLQPSFDALFEEVLLPI